MLARPTSGDVLGGVGGCTLLWGAMRTIDLERVAYSWLCDQTLRMVLATWFHHRANSRYHFVQDHSFLPSIKDER